MERGCVAACFRSSASIFPFSCLGVVLGVFFTGLFAALGEGLVEGEALGVVEGVATGMGVGGTGMSGGVAAGRFSLGTVSATSACNEREAMRKNKKRG